MKPPTPRHAQIAARVHDLLETAPSHHLLSFDDVLEPHNRDQWDALHVALNDGKPLDTLDAIAASAVREEAAFLLGVAATLRAVRHAHHLVAGTVPLPGALESGGAQ
jgi:uncharacterized protein involved in propanediol utilization